MKRIRKLAIVAVAVLTGLLMTGCFGFGNVPMSFTGAAPASPDQIYGMWELLEIHTGPATYNENSSSAMWTGGYFIEFNDDGTFSQKDFWNYKGVTDGTWSLDNGTLAMATESNAGPDRFISSRTVRISTDEEFLRIIYSKDNRTQTETYARSAV